MLYAAWNGAMSAGNTPIPPITTGTATKTLMQLKANATASFKVKSWGICFDGITAATPIKCELIETGTVAATVTAYVAADIYPYENAAGEAWIGQLGGTASGYTSSGEGTITATRLGDYQLVAPTNQYLYDWVLSNEFQVPAGKVCRIRVTAAAAVNAICFMKIEQ
jgi:hypothetical protein